MEAVEPRAARPVRWLPPAIRGVLYAVLMFTVAYLACLAWDFDHLTASSSATRMRGWLVVATLIAVFASSLLLGADRGMHREFHTAEAYFAFRCALRTGKLPALADPDVWRRWLRLRHGSNRMTRWAAYLVLVCAVAPSLIRQPAYHPVFASLIGLLAAWQLLSSEAKRARIALLDNEAERVTGTEPTSDEVQIPTWFTRLLAVYVPFSAALAFSGAFALAYLDRHYQGSSGSLDRLVAWAAVVGLAVATHGAVRLRVLFGPFEQHITFARALRTGVLPAHIEPEVWRNRLNRIHSVNKIEPWWAALLAVTGLWPSVTNHSAYWVTASSFGLLAMQILTSWQLSRAQITTLENELGRRTA